MLSGSGVRTMYGCNKLYCEMLGNYYDHYYRQLAAEQPVTVDFRCVRFPGLISAFTVPTGGTSDYAPEMIHAAARGEPCTCFVNEEACIPFMASTRRGRRIGRLARPRNMTRSVYNVTSFSLSAAEVREMVMSLSRARSSRFAPDDKRAAIVDETGPRTWTTAPAPGLGLAPRTMRRCVSGLTDCRIFGRGMGREGQEQRLKIEDCDPARGNPTSARSRTSLAIDPIFNL
ncbi:MAG: hypothetical protein R3A10_05695 [Caldilineaceae bacterium]